MRSLLFFPVLMCLVGLPLLAADLAPDIKPPPTVPPPILTAYLPGDVIYCRFASFQPATDWKDFAAQLNQWLGQGAQGVVLDLRSNAAPDDFAGAAQVAGFFIPAGTPLFTVKDPQQHSHDYASLALSSPPNPALATTPLAILVDDQTSGAAEALAAELKAGGAFVLGDSTMGRGAVFTDGKSSPGQEPRYMSGQVVLADGTDLWNHPINPDIELAIDDKKEKAVLALIGQNKVLDVIREAAQRHRMSEAALVKGEDPEIDSYMVPHDKDKKGPGPLDDQDIVLVNAIDSLRAIRLSERPPVAPESGPALPEGASAVR